MPTTTIERVYWRASFLIVAVVLGMSGWPRFDAWP